MKSLGTVCQVTMVALLAVGLLALPAVGDQKATKERSSAVRQPAEPFGRIPLPVAQTITKENSIADMLRIDVTDAVLENDQYVSYVRIVWGDLDDVIRDGGPQYYSNWDGQLRLASGKAQIAGKICFDDGGRDGRTPQPKEGSGADQVLEDNGSEIVWKAGVVGHYDGLLIKIVSDSANTSATIKAGKFEVPIKIAPAK